MERRLSNKGPLLLINEAVEMAGITRYTLTKYVKAGYLDLQFGGEMVYYRDLLRASWVAKQNQQKNSGSYQRNGVKYK